jgi:hypothetical protein
MEDREGETMTALPSSLVRSLMGEDDPATDAAAALERAKASIRRSARAIASIGCDPQCHPERVHWFRRQAEFHTDLCVARYRFADAARTYADLAGPGPFQKPLQAAYEAEIDLLHAALQKAGM